MDISAYQHMSIRMSTRGKRPLRNLTPSDKVRAIQRIHNGETKASVSRDIGVPESTLRGWCKNEQKLRFMCRQLGAADQLTTMPGIENPPEKRPRFESHIQTPKYPATSSFDEFGYNSLPLSGLSFPSNGSNAILEKIALNEIMKKHMVPIDNAAKPPVDNISTQMSTLMGGPTPISGDYNSQLSIMQNLNLLSLLIPNVSAISSLNLDRNESFDPAKNKVPLRTIKEYKEMVKTNCNAGINTNNNTSKTTTQQQQQINNNNNINYNIKNSINNIASLSVKNWAKDPAENSVTSSTNHNTSVKATNNCNYNGVSRSTNDSNNNTNSGKDKDDSSFATEAPPDVLNLSLPLPLGMLQIRNINNTQESESGSNVALLDWCKVFDASLNFLALAAAAAALQPNGSLPVSSNLKKEDNILYKELTKTANLCDSAKNATPFIISDISNDSYFDSEPEDLSVRSTTTSKVSSPANSRSESPAKSNGSCSPLQSDGEH